MRALTVASTSPASNVQPVLIRYCDDQFDSESATATIGVDVKVRCNLRACLEALRRHTANHFPQVKRLSIRGKSYRINIHDTAGQERFRALSTSYYRGAHGIILVYDTSNRDSFSKIERSYEEALANENLAPGAVTYLVGSQIDKQPVSKTARRVTTAEGETLAARHESQFCEVSSKTGRNVRKPFTDIVDKIVSMPGLIGRISQRGRGIDLGGDASATARGCLC